MPQSVHEFLVSVTHGLEIVGAGALIAGFVIATVQWLVRTRTRGVKEAHDGYRRALGRVVLVGLEVLVAATILKTVTVKPPAEVAETAEPGSLVEPTLESLGLLALMVAIRTFLGWTMVLEIDGRWPWQRRAD